MSDADFRDIAAWCKAAAREGAHNLHQRANGPTPVTRTNTESAAIARKQLDERSRP